MAVPGYSKVPPLLKLSASRFAKTGRLRESECPAIDSRTAAVIAAPGKGQDTRAGNRQTALAGDAPA